jgi:hypothetical protein
VNGAPDTRPGPAAPLPAHRESSAGVLQKRRITVILEKAVETANDAKHAKGQGLAQNPGFIGKVTFASVTVEAFQRLFSRGSGISRFHQLPF